MPAEENKALIRRIFDEALNEGNLSLVDELFSPDFVDNATPEQPAGPTGVKAYFQAVRTGFPDIQVTIDDLIAEGDKVVVRTTWHGTHQGHYEGVAPTHRTANRTMIQIFRIASNRVQEEWNEGQGLLGLPL
ncbi:MAG TPA: ester cyclase [Ktedonobacteraceae bacterium]|nr:ester cyclase [Ktedonobacteraceae bacterium]